MSSSGHPLAPHLDLDVHDVTGLLLMFQAPLGAFLPRPETLPYFAGVAVGDVHELQAHWYFPVAISALNWPLIIIGSADLREADCAW